MILKGMSKPLEARDNKALIVLGRLKPGVTLKGRRRDAGRDRIANGESLSSREQRPDAGGAADVAHEHLHQSDR